MDDLYQNKYALFQIKQHCKITNLHSLNTETALLIFSIKYQQTPLDIFSILLRTNKLILSNLNIRLCTHLWA